MALGYDLCFTERARNRVICWNPDRKSAEVIAGKSEVADLTQRLNDPYGLALDCAGNLLIADKLNHRICRLRAGRIDALLLRDADGHRRPLAESGREYVATLFCPTGLYAEMDGSLLATFSDDHTLYRIHPDGRLELLLGISRNRHYLFGMCQQFVSPEEVGRTPLRGPTAVVKRRDGTIFFIERYYQTVRQYAPAVGLACVFPLTLWRKHVLSKARVTMDSSFDSFHPNYPSALALDSEDNLFMADTSHGLIFQVDFQSKRLKRVMYESGRAGEGKPVGVAFSPDGLAWVMDGSSNTVRGFERKRDGGWRLIDKQLSHVAGEPLKLGAGGAGIVACRQAM